MTAFLRVEGEEFAWESGRRRIGAVAEVVAALLLRGMVEARTGAVDDGRTTLLAGSGVELL